ncbi:14111_t:CDS:2, partial [Dentiscutata heterogama]
VEPFYKEKGIRPNVISLLPKFIEQNNELTDFGYSKVNAPLGDWDGYFGFVMLKSVRKFMEEFAFMPDIIMVSKDQYIQMLDNFEKEASEIKTSMDLYRFFARKVQIN